MKNLFVHLRVHSNFSLAEGMLSFDYLSEFCKKNNQPAIAITDTSNMFGVLEFSIKMVSNGIQPIIGIQVNISGATKLDNSIGEVVLIAKNEIGYKNLLVLTSKLSNNSDFDKFINYEDLKNYRDGLILLTGGIENGFLYYNGRISDNYKLSNGKFVNVETVEGVISDFVETPFIIYGEHDTHNALITTENISKMTLDLINENLDKQLQIKSVVVLDDATMSKFYTPKMSIKRKKLVEYVSTLKTV